VYGASSEAPDALEEEGETVTAVVTLHRGRTGVDGGLELAGGYL